VNQTVDSMKKIADKISIIGEIASRPTCWPSTRPWKRPGPRTGKGFRRGSRRGTQAGRTQPGGRRRNQRLSHSSVAIAETSASCSNRSCQHPENLQAVQEITASSIEQNTAPTRSTTPHPAAQPGNPAKRHRVGRDGGQFEELANQAEQLQEAIAFFKLDSRRARGRDSRPGRRASVSWLPVR
jgi:methyl-accepting chemotaxis protein